MSVVYQKRRKTAIAKTDRYVVRNQAYRRAAFSIRKRNSERKMKAITMGDIIHERSPFNIQLKTCTDTCEQQLSRMMESSVISLRGFKADAEVFDELVFDVNSAYFENHGCYEYAKEFHAEKDGNGVTNQ